MENGITVSKIVTLDENCNFYMCKVKGITTFEELDKAIEQGKVITLIEEDESEYRLNSTYIFFYIP